MPSNFVRPGYQSEQPERRHARQYQCGLRSEPVQALLRRSPERAQARTGPSLPGGFSESANRCKTHRHIRYRMQYVYPLGEDQEKKCEKKN